MHIRAAGMSDLRSLSLKGCCALASGESSVSPENNFFALFRTELQDLPMLSKIDITGTGLAARALFTDHRSKSVTRNNACTCLGAGCPQKVCPPYHHSASDVVDSCVGQLNETVHESHLFCVQACALCGKVTLIFRG